MLCKHLHKLYHTFTPFRKKGGCITCTGLHKRTALCTVFILFPFKIIQLTCIIFFSIFLTKAHGRIHTASYTAAVLDLRDSAIADVSFFLLPWRWRLSRPTPRWQHFFFFFERFQFKVTSNYSPARVHTLVGIWNGWTINRKMLYKIKEVLADRVGSPFSFFRFFFFFFLDKRFLRLTSTYTNDTHRLWG